MNRIICIGNRLLQSDAAGPRVYDSLMGGVLQGRSLPEGVEVIDGGTAGLNLLGLIEGCHRVVFVDSIEGYLPAPGIRVLDSNEIPEPAAVYDHGAGLPYLMKMIPHVCDRAPSSMFVVGIEGKWDDRLIQEAARTSLRLAGGNP